MTTQPPDFDELVGADLEPRERERLLRVHELLVAAGPPPELSSDRDAASAAASVRALPRRRRGFLAALAAALAVLVFAVGYLAGARGDDPSTFDVVAMSGVGEAQNTSATLEIFDVDERGNWPMEIEVRGLPPSTDVGLYELWLTKDGKLAAACGSFFAEEDGVTIVPLNAPFKLDEYDAWVVVEEGSEIPLLTT
jgi:hypothetical protein